MSIAEKLIEIAQNEPKVYEAGKISQIQGIAPAAVDASLFGGKLKTIAENTIKVFEKGRADANLQKATASGKVVRVDDVNPIEHELGVRVRGKNLVDDTKRLFTGGAIFFGFTKSIIPIKLSKGTYTFSVVTADGTTTNLYIKNSDNTKTLFTAYSRNTLTFTLSETQDILLNVYKSGYTSTDDVVTAQLELGTTATPYTPYISDFSGISVTRYGKNLCPTSTLQVQGNGAWTSALLGKFDLPDGIYTFSCEYDNLTENNSIVGIHISDKNGNRITETYGDNGKILRTFAVTNGITLHLYTNFSGTAIETDIIFKNIQLEEGSTATEYEPYKEPRTATAKRGGTVEGLRSLSPTTTLISDSDSVIITADYYKKGAATS